MCGLRGGALTERVDEVREIISLTDRQKHRVENFSGGMAPRVNIGAALLHKPAVITMDEPTVGIDPRNRRSILGKIKLLNSQGMTVLYTTHYMEEAQELSDHIAIMNQRQVIANGTHAELVKLVGELDRIDIAAPRRSNSCRRDRPRRGGALLRRPHTLISCRNGLSCCKRGHRI